MTSMMPFFNSITLSSELDKILNQPRKSRQQKPALLPPLDINNILPTTECLSTSKKLPPPLPLFNLNGTEFQMNASKFPLFSPTASSESSSNSEQDQTDSESKNSLFKTELCTSFMSTGHCRYSKNCRFAHGEHELRGVTRHPKYKTQLCRSFLEGRVCQYGKRCCYLHQTSLAPPQSPASTGSNQSIYPFFTPDGTQIMPPLTYSKDGPIRTPFLPVEEVNPHFN